MNTHTGEAPAFNEQEWAAAMAATVEGIDETGRNLVATHRQNSARAEEVCRNWGLEERQAEERIALESLIAVARKILRKLNSALESGDATDLAAAAEAIEDGLPEVESAFLTVRHGAQDLLQWADRHGDPAHHGVTDTFRALHGRLTAWAPVFKPRLEAFQMDLVAQAARPGPDPAVGRLLSAITRYNAVLDSARRFVAAVVDPPLELVFAETDRFLEDVEIIPLDQRAAVASKLNDACRRLMYEPAVFYSIVQQVDLPQPDGIESSLALFESHGICVLLSVEEDPIFGQLKIHLLRAVVDAEFENALAEVTRALAAEWS